MAKVRIMDWETSKPYEFIKFSIIDELLQKKNFIAKKWAAFPADTLRLTKRLRNDYETVTKRSRNSYEMLRHFRRKSEKPGRTRETPRNPEKLRMTPRNSEWLRHAASEKRRRLDSNHKKASILSFTITPHGHCHSILEIGLNSGPRLRRAANEKRRWLDSTYKMANVLSYTITPHGHCHSILEVALNSGPGLRHAAREKKMIGLKI